MTELIKSMRMYRVCVKGLPRYSLSTHLFAVRTVLAYRENRVKIMRENQLGYSHQLRNLVIKMVRGGGNYGKEQDQQKKIDPTTTSDPYKDIKIKRVDYSEEIKRDRQNQKEKKVTNAFFKIKMFALSVYYNMNVKSIAGKLSAFLRLYHESLQGLVQGYREVTMDAKGDFKFEKDGKSV